MARIETTPTHVANILSETMRSGIERAVRAEVKRVFNDELEKIITEYTENIMASVEMYKEHSRNDIKIVVNISQEKAA